MSSYSEFFGGGPRPFASGHWDQYEPARSLVDFQVYIKTAASGTSSTDPSADLSNWTLDGAAPLKPYQRGVAALASGTDYVDVTINTVNQAKAKIRIPGISFDAGYATDQLPSSSLVRPSFFSNTVLRLARTGAAVYSAPLDIAWEIEETV